MNIDGDFVTRFGDRLPVPYMEKITVRDDTFEIQVSFYIKPPNLDEIDSEFYDDYLDSLNDLKVSIVTVADGVKESSIDSESGYSVETHSESFYSKYGPISIGSTGTMLFDHLMTNDINILQIATPTNKSYSSPEDSDFRIEQVMNYGDLYFMSPNCSTVLYDEALAISEYAKEDLYNSQGELVHKYTRNITIVDEGTLSDSEGTFNTVGQYVSAMTSGLTTHFVAFTTSLSEYPNGFTEEQRKQITNAEPQAHIMFKQVSDLSYEQLSADNAIKASEITIFKTPSGEFFDGNVLQSIDSTYYGNSQLTNQDVINTFTDLIGTTSDEDLQSKFDNLAYTLTVHGKKSDILVRLNDFRKTFVETSTATPVGRFHEKLEIRLYNTNNAVKNGILVLKTLNVSPTVVDGRETLTIPYEPPTIDEKYDSNKANNFVYTKSAKLGAYALPAGYNFSTEEAQAQFDSFNSLYEQAKELENELADACQESFELVLDSIQAAFNEMNEIAAGSFEGIPESIKSEYRYHELDFLGLTVSARHDPVTIGVDNTCQDIKLYVERDNSRTGTAGDLDGDGVVTTDPTWATVTVKVWPVPINYVDLFNEIGIKKINDSGAYEALNKKDIYAVAYQKTERSSAINSKFYEPWKEISDAPSSYTSVQYSYFYELQTAISRAYGQSGAITIISVDKEKVDFGLLANFSPPLKIAEWIANKEDTVEIEYIFDSSQTIQQAVLAFSETYKAYLDACINTDQTRVAGNAYAQLAALGGIAGVDLIYTKYNLYLNGFVFFDYEKALHRASNISRILDVAKAEKLFGRELSHTYFKVVGSKIEKFYDASIDDTVEPADLTSGGSFGTVVVAGPARLTQ
jgi:hypothetical protein